MGWHFLVLFPGVRCLDGRCFQASLRLLRWEVLTCLLQGDALVLERKNLRSEGPGEEDESTLTPETQRWVLRLHGPRGKWLASLKAWVNQPMGTREAQCWWFSKLAPQRALKKIRQALLEPRARKGKLATWRGGTDGEERFAPGHFVTWRAECLPYGKAQLATQSRRGHSWRLGS